MYIQTQASQWRRGKEFTCQCRKLQFDASVGEIPWRRKWQPTPVFLPGKFYGQRSLVGYSPWGRKELNTAEQTHTDTYTLTPTHTQSHPHTHITLHFFPIWFTNFLAHYYLTVSSWTWGQRLLKKEKTSVTPSQR